MIRFSLPCQKAGQQWVLSRREIHSLNCYHEMQQFAIEGYQSATYYHIKLRSLVVLCISRFIVCGNKNAVVPLEGCCSDQHRMSGIC